MSVVHGRTSEVHHGKEHYAGIRRHEHAGIRHQTQPVERRLPCLRQTGQEAEARSHTSVLRQAYALREQAAADGRKRLIAEQAADRLTRSAEDYRARADVKRKRLLGAQEETKQARRSSHLACMLQLKAILEHRPELIEQATTGGYVADLMRAIDQHGTHGDAERMLRHLGYTGPIPQ